MRLAIPVRNERVSPVFDEARRLVLVDVENGMEQARREEILHESFPNRRARRLTEIGVNVLICGAISRPLVTLLAAFGITVIPCTVGPVDEVLAAYLKGRLSDPRWRMPGCGGGQGHHLGGRGPGSPASRGEGR